MKNKRTRILAALVLALSSTLVRPAASSKTQGQLSGLGVHDAVFKSFTGACGGWVKDVEQEVYCCTLDQRPTCDDEGICQCSFDDYCYKICTAAGNCDQKGTDCPEEEGN